MRYNILKEILVYLLTVLFLPNLYSSEVELPDSFLELSIGQKLKDVKNLYQLKKIISDIEYLKKYSVIYLEEQNNIETSIYTFELKICKIKVTYLEQFFSESDFENVYNQAQNLYGLPNKSYIETKNEQLNEILVWENSKLLYTLTKTIDQKNNFKSFSISIIDKNVELKIANLTPIKKFYYKILQKFF